jgi:4-hydroxybenzoate polyprenyltransferase
MGCAWNDIVDMNIDRSVERTKQRPMARGANPIPTACSFTFGLFISWIAILSHAAPSELELFSYAAPLTVLVVVYPYAKRFTSFAQAVLGVTLAWGVVVGAAFGGMDIFRMSSQENNNSARPHTMDASAVQTNARIIGLGTLCATYFIWTVLHDTIYAFQDLRDDQRIGMNSMAIRLKRHARVTLGSFSIVQVTLLAYTAKMIQSSLQECTTGVAKVVRTPSEFAVISVLGNAVLLPIIILRVDLQNPQSCGWWFKSGCVLVGSSIGLGLLAQYLRFLQTRL